MSKKVPSKWLRIAQKVSFRETWGGGAGSGVRRPGSELRGGALGLGEDTGEREGVGVGVGVGEGQDWDPGVPWVVSFGYRLAVTLPCAAA